MTRKFPPRYIPKNLCRFGPRNIYNTTLHMQTTYKTVLLTTVKLGGGKGQMPTD